MIYLANGLSSLLKQEVLTELTPLAEVTQQSKARHKEDFLHAFSPFIADAASVAYKGASVDVQGKLRRVVDVWRERNIFEKEVLQDLNDRLAGERLIFPFYTRFSFFPPSLFLLCCSLLPCPPARHSRNIPS